MFKMMRSPWLAECSSAALVFITAAIIGREAAAGMSVIQWSWAVVSVLGSISVAVMVHCWPSQAKANTQLKAFQRAHKD